MFITVEFADPDATDRNRSSNLGNETTDPGLVGGIVMGSVTLGLVILAVIALLCYRHYLHRNVTSMNFDNPVYRKTTEDQFSLEKNRFPIPTAPTGEEVSSTTCLITNLQDFRQFFKGNDFSTGTGAAHIPGYQ